MTEISFFAGEALFTAVWLLLRVIVWLRNGKIDWKREAQLLLMYVNLFVIIRFAFYPFFRVDGRIQPLIFEAEKLFPPRLNFIPIVRLFDYEVKKELLINLIGNTALFIPSGIILPILYPKLDSLWKVLAVGKFISIGVEILQLPFPSRVTDVDDLILNMVGLVIGYGIYALADRRKRLG